LDSTQLLWPVAENVLFGFGWISKCCWNLKTNNFWFLCIWWKIYCFLLQNWNFVENLFSGNHIKIKRGEMDERRSTGRITTAQIVTGRIYFSKLRLVETAQIELSSYLISCTSEPKTVIQYWPKGATGWIVIDQK
jgi:hypothetical protein